MKPHLSANQTRVLGAVVASHIRKGTPVGSSFLARRSALGLSPASIRNVMAELERLGFLAKPHISAGRVPTDSGYRFYVNRFVRPVVLPRRELEAIQDAMDQSLPVGGVLERVSRLLEGLSHLTGVAIAPTGGEGRVARLETLRASDRTLLLTIVLEPGSASTVAMRYRDRASLESMERLVRRLAGLVVGKEIAVAAALRMEKHIRTERDKASLGVLRRWLLDLAGNGECTSFIFGAGNTVAKLGNSAEASSLLRVLESKEDVARMLLSTAGTRGVGVRIGSENLSGPMKGLSVVSSPYWIGKARGAIGVIGPLRMEYAKMIALIASVSKELTNCLAKQGGQEQSAN